MPIEARPAQVLFRSLGQFRPELLNPSIDARSVDCDAALGQKIDDILRGQGKPQVPAHSAKDDIARKTVMLER